ncbi:MAG: RNA methyltransferase [Alphaproteobacteria bacterium]|nr:RNA methyltransferase [Alphaproteobacteria bacterium]MCL2504655.1 RNA methyltransferase [Alphaproteobacteria bacterium]
MAPVIILVEPQLVENIGMTARAMLNTGLKELRIVNPRDKWPLDIVHHNRMLAASSGADEILLSARVFDTIEEAIADIQYVYATTARTHDMVMKIMTPRKAASDMIERQHKGEKTAVLFGRERTGLINDDLVLANSKITIPLNPEFTSLNLAQAVLLIGYEWYQAQDSTKEEYLHIGNSSLAAKEEYLNFFNRFETALEESGFFPAPDMKPSITRNLMNIFERAEMTSQEVRTMHGVLSALKKR